MDEFLLTSEELRARGGGKWRKYPSDVLPAFVADMDFKVAPPVQAAFERIVTRQDYVYELMADHESLFAAFASWMRDRYAWTPDPSLTIAAADVVQGIVASLVAYSKPGDGVVTQTPAYPPFLRVITGTGRRLVENRLTEPGERYSIDEEGLRRAARDARVLLLCHPHNPTGRVFERRELDMIAGIAADFDLVIVSDEIHADLTFAGATHIPMETVAGARERTVTLSSATKGFNIPGARAAVVHFGTPELKERFDAAIPEHLLGRPSRFGLAATIAAWTEGAPWLDEMKRYLERNRSSVTAWADSRAGVGYRAPEATFLAWFDCRGLRLPAPPYDFFLESARVALGDGREFGPPGEGHVRLNFGTSAAILDEILGRMSRALDET